MSDLADIARACYQAYAEGDRAALEPLIADDFRFTSPLDNGLDRKTYFERCWPTHTQCEAFDFVHVVPDGDKVFVVYEGQSPSGKRFRNCERLTVRGGQITEVEVYFGWNLPHEAPAGGFVDR